MSTRPIYLLLPILLLMCLLAHARAESIEHMQLSVGEQISISAEGVEKYSEGQKGIVDIRLPEDGKEFIVVGLRPGTTTLLLIKEGGDKLRYQFEVKALGAEVPARENIRLDFYFVELSESGQYQIGVAWPGSIGVDMDLDLAIDASGITGASASLSGLPLPRLDALHRSDWARIARQASVVTANGEQAVFDSGGEVNIAIEGSLAAELRQIPFGTKLAVLPRFDKESGRLELRIEAEVSSLGEGRVPSRTRSTINTVVNVEINQAIVLAGLYAKSTSKNKAGLPFFSQLPVIGTLFGSHGKRHEQVQNVVFIVPSIVDVVDAKARTQIGDALRAYERFGGDIGKVRIAPTLNEGGGAIAMHLLVTDALGRSHCHQFASALAIVVGRDPGCDLVLEDCDVSRHHLVIQEQLSGWQVEDTSSNGTFVGNRLLRHESLRLDFDQEVRVGPYRLRRYSEAQTNTQNNSQQAVESGVDDKAFTHLRREIHRRLLDSLQLAKMDRAQLSDQQMRPRVLEGLGQLLAEMREQIPSAVDSARLVQELADEVLGLGPLESLLADDAVSEIMVVHPQLIFAERAGKIERTNLRFTDDDSARAAIERIVTPLGRRIDESTPFVDARLKDGSRVNAVIRPLALQGACITIRKFAKHKLSLEDLVGFGSIDEAMARFLRRSVASRRNIVISGGTGSGKTTLLNVLSQSIASEERVVTIEDAAELQLAQEHVVSLETRPANMEGRGEITIRDLVKNALRMRPDRILVGECRGGEALDMLQAMNTGHDGSMTTTHANSPEEAVRRLETLVLMSGLDLPGRAIREQIAGSVDLIVQQSRLSDGSRKVTSITEVVGIEDGHVQLQEIFRFHRTGTSSKGKAEGRYQATGLLPSYLEELIRLGLITGEDYL